MLSSLIQMKLISAIKFSVHVTIFTTLFSLPLACHVTPLTSGGKHTAGYKVLTLQTFLYSKRHQYQRNFYSIFFF